MLPVSLSLIVPTRNRPGSLRRLLDSLIATAADPSRVEVVLVVDDDAIPALNEIDPRLSIQQVVVPPGQTMGTLNAVGFEAAGGEFLMLLNDDVVVRTPHWDDRLLDAARQFHDGVVLVHVNDTLMRHHLCTFPLLSRTVCEILGGICPREYVRYRIDDHIEDLFNLLGILGERRTIYLPEVVFEHANGVELACGVREYHADPKILALDAPRFDALQQQRKELALRLWDHIEGQCRGRQRQLHEERLAQLGDAFSLRCPSRLKEMPPGPDSPIVPRVGVIILTDDPAGAAFGATLGAMSATTPIEVIVLDRTAGPSLASRLNKICRYSAADYLVVVEESVRLSPGWLDRLLACVQPDVAVVTPLLRRAGGKATVGGLVFAPDGSGHHSPWSLPIPGVVPAFSLRSPIFLFDRGKVEQILFNESFGHYFLDCDLGLRAWENGWRVVVTPEVVAELTGGPLPYAQALDETAFEADRRRFVELWTDSGRFDRLCRDRWRAIPSLQHWLTLSLEGDPGVSALAGMRHCPILLHYLQPRRVERAERPGRLAALAHRLGRCWKEYGVPGLARAATRRAARAVRWGWAKFQPPGSQAVPNPTREAAEYPGE